nr:hypothetical protein B0A51_01152 [Rachicladosporium sp. CCFEE 5018]
MDSTIMDGEAEGERAPLFEGVHFAVIPGEKVNVRNIVTTLEAEGGTHHALNSNQTIQDLASLTHIISSHVDFPEFADAVDMNIDVVKPAWIETSVRRGKPANARPYNPDPAQIFSDLVVTAGNLPDGDVESIWAGVIALGGQWSGSLTKITTHIVTNDLNDPKCKMVQERQMKTLMVLPHWFDTCLRLGKKINERPYKFPNPDYLDHTIDWVPKAEPSPWLEGATTDRPSHTPESSPSPSPSESRKNLNVFMSKTVYFAKDLELSTNLRSVLCELIQTGGGLVTKDAVVADIYIGRYRDGSEYVSASRARKTVASLAWLYHVIQFSRWKDPTTRLLHYPVPRNGIPGFGNMVISVSNYSGESRVYLENLVKYCGAEFTKTMKHTNTHLITAHKRSEKVEAAEEWNINIINHLWLEECYAKCMVMPLSNPKYTVFPTRTNLGELCGQMSFDMDRVERAYFRAPPSPAKAPSPKISKRKSVPQSSVPTGRRSDEYVAVPEPTPIAEDLETEAEEAEEEAEEEEEPEPIIAGKKPRGRPRKSSLTAATPRNVIDGKENESPMSRGTGTGGRAAKQKAHTLIGSAVQDANLYSKEAKRKGGVIYGGRRSDHPEDFSSPVPEAARKSKKRASDEGTYDVTAQGSDLSDGETQKPGKKLKTSKTSIRGDQPVLPPVVHRMMVTGDERWINKPRVEDADRIKLRQVGVLLMQDPKEITVLVAKKILRTPKFVCALAWAPMVVDTKYLDAALKGKLIDNSSTLSDRDAEERLGFKLVEALDRARINNRQLLRGWKIYVSRDISGTFDTFKTIITVNGGAAYAFNGRTGLHIEGRVVDDEDAGPEKLHQGGEEEYDFVYLVSGTTAAEQKLWPGFRNQVVKAGFQPRIVRSDWLLNAAMSQQVSWKESWALSEGAK